MNKIPFTPDERTRNREGAGWAIETWLDGRGMRIEAPTLEDALELVREMREETSDEPVVAGK